MENILGLILSNLIPIHLQEVSGYFYRYLGSSKIEADIRYAAVVFLYTKIKDTGESKKEGG